jgi:amidohydrolase family protein
MTPTRLTARLIAIALLFAGSAMIRSPRLIEARGAQVRSASQAAAGTLFTNAWLIDGTGAPAVDHAWVRIEGDRIAAVGQGAPPATPGAQVVDLAGRTIVPGLADMHAHLGTLDEARWMAKLMLAQGITNIKETGNTLGNLAGIRGWLATDPVTPHVYMSGFIMQGDLPNLRFLKAGPETAAKLQDNYAFGVQFLKAYNWTSSQSLKQMGDFAKASGLVLTGHVPLGMTSIAGIDAGMQILEHVRLKPAEVLDDPDIIARYPIDLSVTRREGFWAYFDPNGAAIRRTLDALARRKDRFFIDPTIVVQWAIANTEGVAQTTLAPYLETLSPAVLRKWRQGSARGGETGENKLTAKEYEEAKGAAKAWVVFVGEAHKRGIRILSGTDTPVEWVIPGHSLHQELEFFVEAGMTPVEAIRCSTGFAAEAFRSRDRGTIAPGKIADLVIVQGNVASDIHNIEHVEHVMLAGKSYEHAALLDAARKRGAEQTTMWEP